MLTKLHNNQSLKPYHLRVRLLLSGTGTQKLIFGVLQTNIGFSLNKVCKSPTIFILLVIKISLIFVMLKKSLRNSRL